MIKQTCCFIVVLLLLSPTMIFSQSFTGGAKVGFDISQVDSDQHGGYKTIFPTGSLYAQTNFGDEQRASIALGISYIRKGSKEVEKDATGDITKIFAIQLDYIEVPVTFSWRLNKFRIPHIVDYTFKNKFCLEIGLSYAYLIKAQVNHGQGFIEPDRAFFNYDCGTHIGLTYFIGDHFFLNYRFSYTLFFLPIRKHPGGQVYGLNRGLYNNVMIFTVGWEF